MSETTRKERTEKRRTVLKKFFRDVWAWIISFYKLLINWKFLLSFGVVWCLFNGIWYVGLGYGIAHNITWMSMICGAYVGMLYFPLTAEKLITVPLGAGLARILFPKDLKLQATIMALLPKRRKNKKKKELLTK